MAYNVLLVDDSPAMLSVLRRVLDMSGIQVHILQATNGLEAIEMTRGNPIDLIVTDLNMPHMDGEQLVRWLAAQDMLASLPVVVGSTDSSDRRVRRLMTIGGRGYVSKPCTPEQLCREVKRVLEMQMPPAA